MSPRREPALIVGAISAILSLLVALNWHGLTSDQAALIVAVVVAVGGVITALATRPIAPGLFTALIGAVAAAASGFGFHWDPSVVGAVGFAVASLLALITRHQVTPVPAAAPARLAR